MKVLVIVALFALVAVQMSHSAPVPEEVKPEVSADNKAAEATPFSATTVNATPFTAVEEKSEPANPDTTVKVDTPAAAAEPVEKKE